MDRNAGRFTGALCLRAPHRLTEVVEATAARKMTTVSEYVRRAVIERLEADGIKVEELTAA